jgi:hypothetical protein
MPNQHVHTNGAVQTRPNKVGIMHGGKGKPTTRTKHQSAKNTTLHGRNITI